MKHIYSSILAFSLFQMLLYYPPVIHSKSGACWADFFEDAYFKGSHFRLEGPAQLKDLTNIKGINWDKRIESIKVGSNTTLIVFENKNFKLTLKEMAKHPVLMKSLGVTQQDILEDSEIIFHGNANIHSFGEYNFYHKIRSIKIECDD